MRAAIITASDRNYFNLLADLIQSVRALPESQELDLCVLDVGLTNAQIEELTPQVTRIEPAQWNLDFPQRGDCPGWFRAMTERPFLPSYFPDYELLIWIDADAWLCNWDAMRLLIHAGWRDGFAVVPELDRCYPRCYHAEPNITRALETAYAQCFGAKAAENYSLRPQANCGVFAMQRDRPYWSIWGELVAQGLSRSIHRMVEQCALNIAIYTGRIPATFLPSWCNWIVASSVPMLDAEKAELRVPMVPHEHISVCHLVDVKDQLLNVTCTDGSKRQMPLTFRAVRAASGNET